MYRPSRNLHFHLRWPTTALALGLALMLCLGLAPSALGATKDPTVYWTATTGPMAVPGERWGLVASLRLPKGRYQVTATATAVGRSGSPNVRQQIACRLILGSRKDQVMASPARSGYGGSHVPMMLTVSGRLKSSASARLRCYGSDDHDEVTIRDIRITAVKAGRLTLQTGMGSAAKRTIIGSGSPRIVEATGDGAFVPGDGVYHRVGSFDLPAGRWYVKAKSTAQAIGAPGTESLDHRCVLRAGADHDDLMFGLATGSSPKQRTLLPLALQVVHDFENPGIVGLDCKGSAPVLVADLVITAMKVGRLTNIPLEAATGKSSGKGSPRVISGWANGPVSIPARSTFKTIRSLDLPKGRWTVVAKLWSSAGGSILSPGANGVARTYCRLVFGTRKSPAQVRTISDYSAVAPMVLSINQQTASPKKVKLQCRRAHTDTQGGALYIKITAMRAKTLVKR